METLPGLNPPKNEYEQLIDDLVAELETARPITAQDRLHVKICRSLAASITAGVAKNRAISGDVEKLLETLDRLRGTDTDADERNLTDDDRAILAALSSSPLRDPA